MGISRLRYGLLNDQSALGNERIYLLWALKACWISGGQDENLWKLLKRIQQGSEYIRRLTKCVSDVCWMVWTATGPSVRVLRSETRLTVYASTWMRTLCQLVARFWVERLSVYLTFLNSSWRVRRESVLSDSMYNESVVEAIGSFVILRGHDEDSWKFLIQNACMKACNTSSGSTHVFEMFSEWFA